MPEDYRFKLPPAPTEGGGGEYSKAKDAGAGLITIRYAGWWRRVAASIPDFVIPTFACLKLADVPIPFFGFVANLIWLSWLVYNYIYLQGRTGQTFGKQLMGLRLIWFIPNRKEPHADYFIDAGYARCAWRLVAHLADLVLPWGWLRPLWQFYEKTYADSLAATVVIHDDRIPIMTVATWRAIRNSQRY